MPTYNDNITSGFFYFQDTTGGVAGNIIGAGTAFLRNVTSPDYRFSYQITNAVAGELPEVDLSDTAGTSNILAIGVISSIQFTPPSETNPWQNSLGTIAWGNGKISQVITYELDDAINNQKLVTTFVISGDEIPSFTTAAAYEAFEASITSMSGITTGAFAPQTDIDLGDFEYSAQSAVSQLNGTEGSDAIDGSSIDDVINGFEGADVITSGGGADRVFGGSGNDVINLGDGNDYVRVGGGVESFDGGAGKDYISYYDSANGITANLEENTISGSWAVNDTIKDFESISGSKNGDDVITGTSGSNTIKTFGGDDRVFAGSGSDKVELGSGNDYVRVGGGVESFDGGSGKDWISYYDSTNGITVNLEENTISGSWAVNDTIKDFESISGSKNGDDVITGTSGSNTIKTYGGDDRVLAGGGTDKIELGSGDDYVRVGGGVESFDGGSGKDYISYYDSSNGIRIDLRDDEVSGSWAVNDTIKDFESASGSKTGNDVMLGTSESNTLKGFGGDDKLYGRSGDDKLVGGDGEDYFDGGDGADDLYGGDDADTFHFDAGEGADIVKDFENNVDLIQLDNFDLTQTEALALATQVGDDVVFDFGNDGMLTIENATVAMMANDLEMV